MWRTSSRSAANSTRNRSSAQQLRDRVAPFDEQHALAVLELVEREVDHVLLALEPIEVDVGDGHAPAHVLAHEREGRRGDVLGRAEPARDALDERGLARARARPSSTTTSWVRSTSASAAPTSRVSSAVAARIASSIGQNNSS